MSTVLTALRVRSRPLVARIARPQGAIVLLAGFAALFALYLYATRSITNTSDDASMLLEGQAMLHGNLILHGWYLPSDSFITSEMPLDALGSVFFAPQQLLKITPVLLYAAAVTGATYLAMRSAPDGTPRWLAALACAALVAFPVGPLLLMVLQGPMHIGTLVLSLLAWIAYDRFVRAPASFSMVGAFALLTALAIVGDPLAELLIVPPVGIVGAVVLWRSRGRDMTARAVLGATALALAAGLGARQLLIATGTHIAGRSLALIAPNQWWDHLQWLMAGIALLFHIDVQHGMGFDGRLLALLLNGGFLLAGVAGFALLLRRSLLPRTIGDSLTSMLSWAIVASFVVFLVSDASTNLLGIRYLIPAFTYAGILGCAAFARVVGQRHLQRVVLALLAATLLTFGVALAGTPAGTNTEQPLVTLLRSHHLTSGLGTFWAANITTLRSDGAVRVLPVALDRQHLFLYRWHADAAWFSREQLRTVQFVVVDEHVPLAPFTQAVTSTFGTPDHIYQVDGYTIFAWDRPLGERVTSLG